VSRESVLPQPRPGIPVERRCPRIVVMGLLIWMGLGSGCSFLFVRPPPVRPILGEEFSCTTSNFWPIWDTFRASSDLIATFLIAVGPDRRSPSRDALVNLGLSWLALDSISAWSGYSRVSQCKLAKGISERTDETEIQRDADGNAVVVPIRRPVLRPPPARAGVPSTISAPPTLGVAAPPVVPSSSSVSSTVEGAAPAPPLPQRKVVVPQQQDQENPGDVDNPGLHAAPIRNPHYP
jgi:hypothetical protein